MSELTKLYGTWRSPFTPAVMAGGLRFDDVQWDTDGQTLVWLERRGAASVLVAQTDSDSPRDLTAETDKIGARVGYGGGDFTVHQGIVYAAGAGGRLYRLPLDKPALTPITPAFGSASAPTVSPDGEWIVFVHSYEDTDGLAVVDAHGAHFPRKLAYGSDFVMQPVWNPAGTQIAYIAWDHPNMPWDNTALWLAEIERDSAGFPIIASKTILISGMSLFQPTFSPDGRYLAYVGELKGWWQVFLYDLSTRRHTALTNTSAEHGQPGWVQGMRMLAWSPDSDAVFVIRSAAGFNTLIRCDLAPGTETQIAAVDAYTALSQIAVGTERLAFIASSQTAPPRIISIALVSDRDSLSTAARTQSGTLVIRPPAAPIIHRRSRAELIPAERHAIAQSIAWTDDSGETIYGMYYPPAPADPNAPPPPGLPPLVILVHGGPTGHVTAAYNPQAQFFATRGYAVLAVNHRGSTGYGKAYRDKLRGMWGVYDVEDCVSGAAYLASLGIIDPDKLVIMGGSAGGYTVLQSLVTRPGVYKAGICLYGVSDLFALDEETHKFESRYNDSLLGALPEAASVWRERSPIFHADRIHDPLLIFQGDEDRVVPPNQSEKIAAALKKRGVPHEYHLFAGEGHGFRKPETIQTMYAAIEAFLRQYVVYS
jgi:dipeptidyl aminopeptidase/acylaminoacyl peptidase